MLSRGGSNSQTEHGVLARPLGSGLRLAARPSQGCRAIEQTLALGVEITQVIGQVISLEPVSENAEQQMAGQVRG